jgi:hypothetical protein
MKKLQGQPCALGLAMILLLLGAIGGHSPIPETRARVVPSIGDRSVLTQSNHSEVEYRQETTLSADSVRESDMVGIVVADSLYSSITPSLEHYVEDLEASGYQTVISSGPLESHEELKSLIIDWGRTYNLVGVVLIGRLPYAEFYQAGTTYFDAEVFVCDLYLMDLDGSWWDLNSDGVFDKHNASGDADIHPEVFVGRIDPTCLTWMENEQQAVEEYLAKIHTYRTGGLERSDRALVYIDDDWSSPWGTMWNQDVGLAYSERTFENEPQMTTGGGWLNYLSSDYQWAHLCAHSSPIMNYFGPGGVGQGTVSSSDIHDASPTINFYNLFCCSGADWTAEDNLGVTYVFGGDYGLATIGSSKTGSMMDLEHFYQPLGQNETLGESLVDWFSESLDDDGEAGEDFLHWYYGMNIVGDPTLAIEHDCTAISPEVASPTHPMQAAWYNNGLPIFEWAEPPEINGVAGYYYLIDQNPTTMPAVEESTFTPARHVEPEETLSDGSWFLHVITEDSLGNRAERASHFRVNIDKTAPMISITSQPPAVMTSVESITLEWSASDLLSGYAYSEVWIDNSSNIQFQGNGRSFTVDGLQEGENVINVTVFDGAGNSASDAITVLVDLTDPEITSVQPLDGALVGSTLILSWTVNDTTSGYSHALLAVDEEDAARIDGPKTSLAISGMEMGEHILHLTVYDRVNRSDSVILRLNVHPIMDIPWTFVVSALAVIACGIVFIRRRNGE